MEAGNGITRRQALRITAVTGLSVALGGGVVAALLREAGLHQVRSTRIRLGTPVTMTLVHPDAQLAAELVDRAFHEMDRLEEILSRHRPHTPLSVLNREGILHTPPEELTLVLDRALHYAGRSNGAFDPTILPLLEFHRGRTGPVDSPDFPESLARVLSLVDHRGVRLDDHRISLEPGMGLTLDGIAKGFVVDRVVELLVAGGVERVLVDAGGDMASTHRDGVTSPPWEVALQHPRDPGASLGTLHLKGNAVATSGDYVQFLSADRGVHHLLDPRTGVSPEETSGVSVVAPSAMDADALSTAAFVLGPEKGASFLAAIPGVEGLLVTREGRMVTTPGFSSHLI
jgi:FAD:protein FMN transferase